MHRILLIALASLIGLAQLPAPARAAEPATSLPTIRPDDVVLGKADAKITVFEYASLTCPHCADFAVKTFPEVKKNWIDTGKVRWVYRDFPFDPVALKAHVIAHCGGPDRFYGFIDLFYREQRTWYRPKPDEAVAELGKLVKLGGVTPDQLKACLSDDKLSTLVVTNRQSGDAAGVDSTPTFFINGSKSVGFKEYPEFEKLLEAAS